MPYSIFRFALLLLLLGLPTCGGSEDPADGTTEVDLVSDTISAETWVPEGHAWVDDWTSLVEKLFVNHNS